MRSLLVLSVAAGAAHAVAPFSVANPKISIPNRNVNGTSNAACLAYESQDIYLLGSGRCVDAAHNTTTAYTCTEPPCPALGTVDSCGVVCSIDPGCTGFELVAPASAGRVLGCSQFEAELRGEVVCEVEGGGRAQSTTPMAVSGHHHFFFVVAPSPRWKMFLHRTRIE